MYAHFILVWAACLGNVLSYRFVQPSESSNYPDVESEDYPFYIYRNKSKQEKVYGYDVEQRDHHKGTRDQYTSASASAYSDSDAWSGYGGGGSGSFGGSGGLFGGGKPGGIGSLGGKGRQGAKALLAVIIPLALLAAMGPLLASQVMLPLAVASSNVPLASLTAGRRRRSLRYLRRSDPRAEFYRRLDMLGAIQRYLAEVGEETVFREDLMASYLSCSGLLDPKNHCLERLACEYSDVKRRLPLMEEEVVTIVFYNIMKNKHIPEKEKQRFRKAARYGKFRKGDCSMYYCSRIDTEST